MAMSFLCGLDLFFNPCILKFIIFLVVAKNPSCSLEEESGPNILYIHNLDHIHNVDTVLISYNK